MEKIIKSGIKLVADQIQHRARIREETKRTLGGLLDLHPVCLGVIREITLYRIEEPGNTNESISLRLALGASFIQGIEICEVAIVEGLYSQAASILKQEMETIAAMKESSRDIRKNKVTPRISHLTTPMGRIYGMLNGISHTSDKELFVPIYKLEVSEESEIQPVSITPKFNQDMGYIFYGVHLVLLMEFIDCLLDLESDLHGYLIPEELEKEISYVYKELCSSKILEPEE